MAKLMLPISSSRSVPVLAASKMPGLVATAPGEGALLVAEQLRFEERLGECPAVDGHEGFVAPQGVVVDGVARPVPSRSPSRR